MARAQCSVIGCERPAKARGMCGAHTERARRGAPLEGPLQAYRVPFEERITIAASGCWVWQGAVSDTGYGSLSGGRYKERSAHRHSYEKYVGPIPPGMHIDHLCRNRQCVNPSHLEAVTQAENNRRAAAAKQAELRERAS